MGAEGVRITGFEVGDSADLVDAWCRAMPADPITAARFERHVLLDANFDPDGLRVGRAPDGTVAGAAYAVRRRVPLAGDDLEPGAGWIPFFFVRPEYRRRGLGERLLESAVGWLRDLGRGTVDFSPYAPNYLLPGLDVERYPEAGALLDRSGFRILYRAVAMDRSLIGYRPPAAVEEREERLRASGYDFGSPTVDELVPLIDLANTEFNPDWGRAIREARLAGLGLDRIEVARAPDGRIVGWGMCGAYDGAIERFGPFGVLPELRGLGLGEVLLHRCMARMCALGAHGAWFLWTSEQSPAGRLYTKTGFTVTREFQVRRLEL